MPRCFFTYHPCYFVSRTCLCIFLSVYLLHLPCQLLYLSSLPACHPLHLPLYSLCLSICLSTSPAVSCLPALCLRGWFSPDCRNVGLLWSRLRGATGERRGAGSGARGDMGQKGGNQKVRGLPQSKEGWEARRLGESMEQRTREKLGGATKQGEGQGV